MKKPSMLNRIKNYLDTGLPLYFPSDRVSTTKLHLAIWNCGMRPQTLWQAIKDVRITIRYDYRPILVIKKGDV